MLYVFEWLGYQEVPLPMMREAPAALRAVRRPARLHRARPGAADRRDAGLAAGRARALRHVAARDQAERAGGRGGGHRPPGAGRCWRSMVSAAMAAAAGGLYAVVLLVVTPQIDVRRAGLGAGADRHAVRRRRRVLGTGDRRGRSWCRWPRRSMPSSATSSPASRAWSTASPSSSIILLAPDGIYWRIRDHLVMRRQRPGQAAAVEAPAVAAMAGPAATSPMDHPAPATGDPADRRCCSCRA